MYKEFNAYLDMFKKNKSVINEADDDLSLDDLDNDKVDTKEEKTPPKVETPKKEDKPKGEADMKFSIDLATEFSNTVNQFTTVCAKIVEVRMVNKELSDKFYDLYAKIKNLADAASKTE